MGRRSADRATLTCKTLQVLVFIAHGRRQLVHVKAKAIAERVIGKYAENVWTTSSCWPSSVLLQP